MNGDDRQAKFDGVWSREDAITFLDAHAGPMRLAAIAPSGHPILTPIWYMWAEEAIWAAVNPRSDMARALAHDPRCAFEISIETPPYKGVRGRGTAELRDDGLRVLRSIMARHLGDSMPAFQQRLTRDSSGELAVRIVPARLTSWDFSARMNG